MGIQDDTVRIWGRLPTDKAEKMREWADSMGMTQSQFFGICAWAGARQVMRVLEPASLFTPEQWGQIMVAGMKGMSTQESQAIETMLKGDKFNEETIRSLFQDSGIRSGDG